MGARGRGQARGASRVRAIDSEGQHGALRRVGAREPQPAPVTHFCEEHARVRLGEELERRSEHLARPARPRAAHEHH